MKLHTHIMTRLHKAAGQALLTGLLCISMQPASGGGSESLLQFNAIDGIEGDLVVAVGDHGTILHYRHWSDPVVVPSHTTRDLLDVHVGSKQFALAVGSDILLQWDGEAWSKVPLLYPAVSFSTVWASPNRRLVLLGGHRNGNAIVCPLQADAQRQPFCRRFDDSMLGACGNGSEVFILLANGALHRLNNALIGTDGKFDAVYQPEKPLNLSSAWLPQQSCDPRTGLPGAFAIDAAGKLMRFDARHWRVANDTSVLPAAIRIHGLRS